MRYWLAPPIGSAFLIVSYLNAPFPLQPQVFGAGISTLIAYEVRRRRLLRAADGTSKPGEEGHEASLLSSTVIVAKTALIKARIVISTYYYNYMESPKE